MSGKVIGIGGIFVKSRDPKALAAWYAEHLGVTVETWGGVVFSNAPSDPPRQEQTLWTPFAEDTTYLRPSGREFMINLRVDDLDALVSSLRAKGVALLDRQDDSDFGRFRYILDPEGTLLELWEPPLAT